MRRRRNADASSFNDATTDTDTTDISVPDEAITSRENRADSPAESAQTDRGTATDPDPAPDGAELKPRRRAPRRKSTDEA
ncbi:MAG: hypothetical protein H7Z41_19670, partial [Cytophagales bacterium]|nr:hypothetical protein [Armatimonadota bacterium]